MNTTERILPVLGAAAGIMILACGIALTASCRGSDQVPPEGATITLAANPATIVLVGGSGTSDVVATVYSAVGVPQEDQDVRFSSSAGSLFTPPPDSQPAANIPIRTDDLGNAHVNLVTTTTATVTARSGTATGTLTLTTVPGNLSSIILNRVGGAGCLPDTTFLTCSDTLCLEAQAKDTDDNGLAGVVLVFTLQNAENDQQKPFGGAFQPTQVSTDAGGFAHATFRLDSQCPTNCSGANTCIGEIVVTLQGGGFPSTPLQFDTGIQ